MKYTIKLLKIINREVDNMNFIYLYKDNGGWWTAYQTSARRLQMIFPDIVIENTVILERFIFLKYTRIRYERILETIDPDYYVIDTSCIIINPPQKEYHN